MKTLSFVIPVFNESIQLSTVMEALNTFEKPKGIRLCEVIFVNDGSTDDTLFLLKRAKTTILRRFKKHFPRTKLSLISYRQNRGAGFAIKLGMLSSTSDYTLPLDPAVPTPLKELEKFVPGMKANTVVLIGTRKLPKAVLTTPHFRLERLFTAFFHTLLKDKTPDYFAGFSLFSKKATKAIFLHTHVFTWGTHAEMLYLAKKYGFSTVSQPVAWTPKKQHAFLYTELLQSITAFGIICAYHLIVPFAHALYARIRSQSALYPFTEKLTAVFSHLLPYSFDS